VKLWAKRIQLFLAEKRTWAKRGRSFLGEKSSARRENLYKTLGAHYPSWKRLVIHTQCVIYNMYTGVIDIFLARNHYDRITPIAKT
jgi:hypothetical protein